MEIRDFHPAILSLYARCLSGSRDAALVTMACSALKSCRVRRMLLEAGAPVGTHALCTESVQAATRGGVGMLGFDGWVPGTYCCGSLFLIVIFP